MPFGLPAAVLALDRLSAFVVVIALGWRGLSVRGFCAFSLRVMELKLLAPNLISFLWTRHSLTTHICAVQSVHKRETHRTRLAQELHNILVRLKRICHLVRTCLTLCCSLTFRLPRAHNLPHSLFLLPRHQNTQHNRDNAIISKNTQDIMNFSRISQLTSSATKNHSGVKTCRVVEPRARQLPQFMSPKSLRLSRGSKIILEIHINFMMHRKNLENEITELRSWKK